MADYDQDFWERLWLQTLEQRAEVVASRPPSPHLIEQVQGLAAGSALDAGCGHGAEALWLASKGWRVTAVDFSAAALAHAQRMADAAGPQLAERLQFMQADLALWAPPAAQYDLVISLYVHVVGSVQEMVRRLGSAVASDGRLLLVGHLPVDPETGAPTAAAGQVQVSVELALAALPGDLWEIELARELRRPATGSGVDAVIHARRRPVRA